MGFAGCRIGWRAMNRRLVLFGLVAGLALGGPASSASAKLIGFQTPNGNVGCYMDNQSVRCDIRKHEWQAPPPPADCQFDYGYGVFVARKDPARFVCASDTTLDPDHDLLRRGEKLNTGRFRCKNKDGAVRCANRRNGHGFEISKQRVRLF